MTRLSKLTLSLAVLALLSGCGANTVTTAWIKCPAGWQDIRIKNADKLTEPTAQAIEGNNEARRANGCPVAEPQAKPSWRTKVKAEPGIS
ncbi:MAG: hypothetical protein ACRCS9_13985 [Hyphomicrobium sp.]